MSSPTMFGVTHATGSKTWEVRVSVGLPRDELVFGLRWLPSGLWLAAAGPDEQQEDMLLLRFERDGVTADPEENR
jgi:hypothetical protein